MNEVTKTTDRMVQDFLASVEFEAPPPRKRLIFAIDATSSRRPSWDTAAQLQSQMFLEASKYGGLDVQLVYWRGFNEMRVTRFFSSAMPLVQAMSGVACQAGHTQLAKVLRHVVDEHAKAPVAAVVLVGDACEENPDQFTPILDAMRTAKIPVYGFFEGKDPTGKAAFDAITSLTGGALIPFDANSPNQLRELLGAVAAYVAGGINALADQRPEVVALLTDGGKR